MVYGSFLYHASHSVCNCVPSPLTPDLYCYPRGCTVSKMQRRKLHAPSVSSTDDKTTSAEGTPSPVDTDTNQKRLTWTLVTCLLVFRSVCALLSYTAFVPDEYWQALEVAHSMAFGYGYLTWEWHKPIRGFTRPLLYAALYKLLALVHLDWPCLLIVLPRMLHVPLAVLGDWYVMKLGTHVFGTKTGKCALLCNVASWFTFYCITRTLSNSMETSLTPVILYYWMHACESKERGNMLSNTRIYLLLIGVSSVVRPTGAILWPPLVLAHFIIGRRHLFAIVKETILLGLLTLGWSLAIDCFFYGRFVVVQWKFLEFNVLEGHSALYGAYSWHWYFTEDLPVLLFTSLPLVIHGIYLSPSNWSRAPFWLALWELIVHSALSHKEHRYVFPIVPIASVYAGYCIVKLFEKYSYKVVRYGVYGLLLANVPMALYFSLVHQRGTVAVMDLLRKDVTANSSVLFLMPCHTTPFYSHIHQPIEMKFLECPPPIRPDYIDISKAFYSDPEGWLHEEYPTADSAPTHLVLFDVLLPKIQQFVSSTYTYKEVVRLFHTHFPESERYGTHVVVLKKIIN